MFSPFSSPCLLGLVAVPTLAGGLLSFRQGIEVPPGAPFAVQGFDTGDGLPQNTVTAVVEASDGAMWFGTSGGLCRFDGVEWRAFDAHSRSSLTDHRITALAAGPDGSLWVGSEEGFVMRWQRDELETIALLPGAVSCLYETAAGEWLGATQDDLFVLAPGVPAAPRSAERLVGCRAVWEAGDGLWAGTTQGVYRLYPGRNEIVRPGPCFAAAVDPIGCVFLGTADGPLRFDGRSFQPLEELPDELAGTSVEWVELAADGSLWWSEGEHLVRSSPETGRTRSVFPLGARPRSLGSDGGNGIWIGFTGCGVTRLRPSDLVLLGQERGLPAEAPEAVVDDGEGGWFVGTTVGLFHQPAHGDFALVPGAGGPITALHRDADGTVWFGRMDAIGHLCEDGGVDLLPTGTHGDTVRALHRDRGGRLWVGTDRGAFLLEDGLVAVPETNVLAGESVHLVRDVGDDLWFAGRTTLLCVGADGTHRIFRAGVDLPAGGVRALLPGRDGRVWLGIHGAGLVALEEERVLGIGREAGLVDPFVCSLTALGRRWLVGSNRGPYLIDPSDLEAIADGRASSLACRLLVPPHRVAVEVCGGVQPSTWTDGSVAALCTASGLMVTSLNDLFAQATGQRLSVSPVLAGDQSLVEGADGPGMTACRDRTVVLELALPCLERPSAVRYRWRLLPTRPEWSAPSPERTVGFPLPGPGDYVFEALALHIDQPGGASVAVLPIHVGPQFWERTWFRLAVLLAMPGIGWLAFRFGRRLAAGRERHLEAVVCTRTCELRVAHEQLEQRVAERTRDLRQALARIEADHARKVELEREVQRLRRMDSLGHLAGGVAHDFNNILTVMLGHAAILEEDPSVPDGVVETATRIREAGERGRDMTRHLLAVASRQSVSAAPLDLADAVRRQERLLRDLLGTTLRLEVTAPPGPAWIQAAPSQVEQILMNLAVNARDAMTAGGLFAIALEATADEARLVVSDTGSGMSRDVREHAFEPFFTTKPRHAGTGLGLATVYGIVRQLGGTAEIDSEPGRGTRFTIVLPLSGPPGESEPARAAERSKERLRVCLVEDDAAVRHVLARVLASSCEVVVQAGSGDEALERLRATPDVDVVLSDLQMPGIHGLELVEALRAQRPGLPIVFLTGFAEGAAVEAFEARGIELLVKPPERRALVAALQRARAQPAAVS